MKRILILSACLLFLAGFQFAFAGSGGNGQTGNNPDDTRPHEGIDIDIFDVFQSIMTQIMAGAQAYSGSDTGAMPKVTDSTGCVYVDVYLPDSVSAPLPFDSTMTTGSLLIKNCDSQAAQIELAFAFTITINNFIDTTLTIENIFIHLNAGDSAYCEFIFPVPPFNAAYTLCVTASSGDAVMTDCATMVVTGQDIPDLPYHASGFLFQGPDCVLFMEMGDSNAALILENYGEFGPGDSVFVVGTLVEDCGIECTGAFGCVISNTIDSLPGPPPPPPFSACGFLIEGQNCVLFTPEGFGDTAFVLDEYGSFQAGDTVFVSGNLEIGCETDCIDAMGCLRNNIIDTCSISPPPPPPPFEACGILLQGENCVLFTPMGYGDTAFVLDEYGSFQAGDTVFVSGNLEIGCETDCIGAMGCIYNNTIEPCQTPPPPPLPFAGCGLLVQGTNCLLFSPGFAIDTLYTLANYGAFQVNDTVFVSGDMFYPPDSICVDAWGHIDNEVIELCQDTVPNVFAGCGYLYEDQGCVIFQPENQAEGYLLYNYQDFGPGDTVYIEGEIVDCQTDCDVFACIDNPLIENCGPPPPPVFEGCGIILDTQECTLF
ncbi:MAG: hypothetical protein GF310_11910, partial [candidate division Zixibacteria bacterium]|nr:hypothetical protein [candidate division Zixibacteria bacterium]